MKLTMLLACGALATCACASNNKPAESSSDVSLAEPPANPPLEQPMESHAPSGQDPSPGPVVHAAQAEPASAPPPPAEAPPGKADTSNAPATIGTASPGTQPDNTRVNKRDRASDALTPMDQGNGASDLKITQQIRQAIFGDGSLSFTAKNVKIITANGKVTLRGPVNDAQERAAIEATARRLAGDTNVDNQIEVKK